MPDADALLRVATRALPLNVGLLLVIAGRMLDVGPVAALGALAIAAVGGVALLPLRIAGSLTWLELLLVRTALGVLALASASLALADVGLWRAPAIVVIAGALAVAGVVRGGLGATAPVADGDAPPPAWRREDAVVVLIVAVVATLAWPPYEWVLGGRDPGVYVNTAYRIAAEGTIEFRDPVLAAIPRDVLTETSPIDRAPGFYIDPPYSDTVVGQGYHLFPAAMAAGGIASGHRDGLWVVWALGLLALTSAALVARRLAPRGAPPVVAAAMALLLGVSLVVFWYLRFPASEPISMLCLMVGTLVLVAALPDGRRASSVAAALGAGVLALQYATRPDAIVIAPALVAGGAWWYASGQPRRAVLAALGAGGGVFALGALHAWLIADRYAGDVYGQAADRHGGATRLVLAFAVAVAVLAGLAAVLRRPLSALVERRPEQVARALAALGLVAVVGLVGASLAGDWLGGTWLRLYVTWPVIVLAVAGAPIVTLAAARRARLGGELPLLLVGLATAAVYLPDPQIFADQPWAARRFLPVVIPLVLALAVVALATLPMLLPARVRHAALAASGVVLAVIAVRLVHDLRPALGFVEYEGATGQLEAIEARLGPPDALVVLGPHEVAANRVGTYLLVRSPRPVVTIRTPLDRPATAAWLLDEARRRPVVVVDFGEGGVAVPPGMTLVRTGVALLDLPEMERREGSLPREVHRVAGPVVIYRAVPSG